MEFPSIIKPEWVNTEHEYFQTILFNDETHTYDGVIFCFNEEQIGYIVIVCILYMYLP
jgi:hypothetical protein